MPKQTDSGPGFDTETMTLPTMDRPSVVFAWFMDGIAIEDEYVDTEAHYVYLICTACADRIMEVNDGDTLRVIFNTALAHRC